MDKFVQGWGRIVAAAAATMVLGTTTLAGVINVQQYLQTGAATLTASTWDIGHPDFLFDGDPNSLYRTASVNPAVITLQFTFPVTTGAARAWFSSGDTYTWTLEAADTLADLDTQTGSYVQVLAPANASGQTFYMREWNATPVTRRIYRFTVERLTRDDFVHIYGLELQSPEPETTVTINGQPVRINTITVSPAAPKIAVGAQQQFEAEGSLSFGPQRYDLTGLVNWSTPDPGVIALAPSGQGTGVAEGRTVVRAGLGPVFGETVVDVRAARPADLNVGWIHRAPEYNRFRVSFSGDQHIQPGFENEKKWPDPGEIVTYTAHVFNKGDVAATNVAYRWLADGVVVDSGVIPSMGPLSETTLSYAAPWPADEVQTIDPPPGVQPVHPKLLERAIGGHTIRFEIDPADDVGESCELNNAVEDHIGAMTFWFYMDESTYRRFSEVPSFLESYSPEDWIRGQLTDLQRRILSSGARQRVRFDKLVIVEDGGLNPGGVHEPFGTESRGADGRWGFSWPQESVQRFAKLAEGALGHELGHQLGLIDVYNYDIAIDNCFVRLNGALVANTPLMPRVSPWNVAYGNEDYFHAGGVTAIIDRTGRGMMAGPGERFLGAGTVAGLNRNFGLRRGFFGDYLLSVPPAVRLHLTHHDGTPVAGASLRLFARELNGTVPDSPKFAGTTDAAGLWTFPNVTLPGWGGSGGGGLAVDTPWSFIEGGVQRDGPDPVGRNAVFIVEATFNDGGVDRTEYHFIEVDDANVAMREAVEAGMPSGLSEYTYELTTYRSRLANTLPVIAINGAAGSNPIDVFLNEGDVYEATVTAFDADADDVTLSATTLYNSTFDPATGAFRFEPDSYLVNVNGTYREGLSVFFRADDGKFRTVREIRFHVSDVPGFAIVKDITATPPCPCERTGDNTIDVFDLLAYLDLWFPGDAAAELTGDETVDVFDLLTFLDCWFTANC